MACTGSVPVLGEKSDIRIEKRKEGKGRVQKPPNVSISFCKWEKKGGGLPTRLNGCGEEGRKEIP